MEQQFVELSTEQKQQVATIKANLVLAVHERLTEWLQHIDDMADSLGPDDDFGMVLHNATEIIKDLQNI